MTPGSEPVWWLSEFRRYTCLSPHIAQPPLPLADLCSAHVHHSHRYALHQQTGRLFRTDVDRPDAPAVRVPLLARTTGPVEFGTSTRARSRIAYLTRGVRDVIGRRPFDV